MNELAARKRLLVGESELNRQALALELSAISQKTATVERWFALGLKAYPLFKGVITLGSSFRANRRKSSGGLISTIGRSLGLARVFLGFLRKTTPSPSVDAR